MTNPTANASSRNPSVAAATATASPTALPLAAGSWTLDTAHATVGFTIRHLGISKVRGTFGTVDAVLIVGDALASSSVSAVIDLASIDTRNVDRDTHLRSAELLDTDRRSAMTFRSTDIVAAADGWVLHGDLTIGEVTRPVALDVELGGVETFALDQKLHAGFDVRGELSRKDFDLRFGPLDAVLGDTVRLEIDLQFVADG